MFLLCSSAFDSNLYVTISMQLTVVEYVRKDGSNPYRTWFERLPAQAAAKVATAAFRLEMGNTSSVKWIGVIGEYLLIGARAIIYLARDGDAMIILLGGGTKKGQQNDIVRAQALWAEYKLRKAAAKPKGRN